MRYYIYCSRNSFVGDDVCYKGTVLSSFEPKKRMFGKTDRIRGWPSYSEETDIISETAARSLSTRIIERVFQVSTILILN